jgi:hypothetical protein
MSHKALREDKTCLNCHAVVAQRFCPNCGQENIETRQSFSYLFTHFFEDLTHYDGTFWKTIKKLLLRPASLTKEYISGKRLTYLAPVRLYIFISFITFLLITLIPNEKENVFEAKLEKSKTANSTEFTELNDSIKKTLDESKKNMKINTNANYQWGYKSVKELDSIQKIEKQKDKIGDVEYWITKSAIQATQNLSKKEKIEKIKESFLHNFPKVLLIYMPIFAFILWLFHSKKRWYYFDHAIFTLHYFSFLLLIYLILFIINKIDSLIGNFTIINFLTGIINVIGSVWMIYYLFPAHRLFYEESRMTSSCKVTALIFLNSIFTTIILLLFVLYTLINVQ